MGHHQLHIFFFPLMAHGHMIPTLEMAKLFTSRGVKTTLISTPAFAEPIKTAQESNLDLGLAIIEFPHRETGLPDHIVTIDQATEHGFVPMFTKALTLLQEPFEKLIQELNPSCIVTDMFLPWTVNSAAKFGIPRLVFHGTSYLALCIDEQMRRHKPFKNISSDLDTFFVPNLPHKFCFVRTQVPKFQLQENENDFTELMKQMVEAESRSYGVVVNSFYELEPDYADYYRNVLGKKAWHLGPFFLCNYGNEWNGQRGKKSSIDAAHCLEWLDSKKHSSVVYVCFGSMANFTHSQLHEMAIGLEGSGQDFIWVMTKCENKTKDEVFPRGFEEKIEGKCLIIRGWAPQLLILDHPSVGAFVTHCGWNSTLEGICAGVPMVTWPVFAEQFSNEKLVTEVLKIGVSVGNKKWERKASEGVPSEALAKAVRRVMVGEEGEEMKRRAKDYKEMARKAVKEEGSSYRDLSALIEELKNLGIPSKFDINKRW